MGVGAEGHGGVVTVIRGHAATIAETIPGAPKRCPNCGRRVGAHFVELNTGRPDARTTIGWKCTRCGISHRLAEPIQREGNR